MAADDKPAERPTADMEAFKRFEVAGWDHQAATYELFFGRLTRQFADALLDAAGVVSGSHVLDVACGTGSVTARAAERGAVAVGADIAPAMVQLARQLHPDLVFREADVEALPFTDGSFDAVVSNFGVLHFARDHDAFHELARVLRSGGRLALTTWDMPERMRLTGIFLDSAARAGAPFTAGVPAGPPPARFADDDYFRSALHQAGLTDVWVRTISGTHRVTSADELWNGILAGTVRTASAIREQDQTTRLRIRAAFEELLQPYRNGDSFGLPVSVKLARAVKPRDLLHRNSAWVGRGP